MGVRCDDSRYPLLVVHFVPDISDEDVRTQNRFFGENLARMKREQRRGALVVNNTTPTTTLSASQRKMIIDHHKEHEGTIQVACGGIGVVLHSAVQRGVLTAISWLVSGPVPLASFSSLVEAEGWARAQIDKARGLARVAERFVRRPHPPAPSPWWDEGETEPEESGISPLLPLLPLVPAGRGGWGVRSPHGPLRRPLWRVEREGLRRDRRG